MSLSSEKISRIKNSSVGPLFFDDIRFKNLTVKQLNNVLPKVDTQSPRGMQVDFYNPVEVKLYMRKFKQSLDPNDPVTKLLEERSAILVREFKQYSDKIQRVQKQEEEKRKQREKKEADKLATSLKAPVKKSGMVKTVANISVNKAKSAVISGASNLLREIPIVAGTLAIAESVKKIREEIRDSRDSKFKTGSQYSPFNQNNNQQAPPPLPQQNNSASTFLKPSSADTNGPSSKADMVASRKEDEMAQRELVEKDLVKPITEDADKNTDRIVKALNRVSNNAKAGGGGLLGAIAEGEGGGGLGLMELLGGSVLLGKGGKLLKGIGKIGGGLLKGGKGLVGAALGGTLAAAPTLMEKGASLLKGGYKVASEGIEAVAKPILKERGEAALKAGEKIVGKEVVEVGAKTAGKSTLKKIPLLGLGIGTGLATDRAMSGDWTGAGLELLSGAASTLPGWGTAASLGIDAGIIARDLNKEEKVSKPYQMIPSHTPANKPSAQIPTLDSSHTKFKGDKGQYDKQINEASQKYGVDPNLIKAMINKESSFDPNATSNRGAQGLMQMMPGTAKDMGVKNAYDPSENIDGGTKYMGQLLKKYNGDTDKALAAYNWGPGNVDRKGTENLPAETRDYVKKIKGSMGKVENMSDEIGRNAVNATKKEAVSSKLTAETSIQNGGSTVVPAPNVTVQPTPVIAGQSPQDNGDSRPVSLYESGLAIIHILA